MSAPVFEKLPPATFKPTTGSLSDFESFKTRVLAEPAFRGNIIPADFWLIKFFDGYQQDALAALAKTVEWRKEYGYYNLKDEDEKFADDVASGKLIYHGKDKTGAPILIWRVALHLADPKEIERTVRYIVWQVERGIRQGLITDRATLLIDRSDSGSANIEGVGFFRLLVSVLQVHFPELLERIVLFPSNMLLQGVWRVVKPFLDPTVVAKVSILPKDYKKGMLDIIDVDNLLQQHGGTCPTPTAEDLKMIGDTTDSAEESAEGKIGKDAQEQATVLVAAPTVQPASDVCERSPPPVSDVSAADKRLLSAGVVPEETVSVVPQPSELTSGVPSSPSVESARPSSPHDSACEVPLTTNVAENTGKLATSSAMEPRKVPRKKPMKLSGLKAFFSKVKRERLMVF